MGGDPGAWGEEGPPCQLPEDHLGPIPVTGGIQRFFSALAFGCQLPEKVSLSSPSFYLSSREEAPGSGQKHLPLPRAASCRPPHLVLSPLMAGVKS